MMAAHKLGGKQQAMLISSSIRNTGKGKNPHLPNKRGQNWKGNFLFWDSKKVGTHDKIVSLSVLLITKFYKLPCAHTHTYTTT